MSWPDTSVAKAAMAAAGILMLVGCNDAGDPGLIEYYDGLDYEAKQNATRTARDEFSERARQDEMNYRATEDWRRSYGQATEEVYDATWQAAYEQGLTD